MTKTVTITLSAMAILFILTGCGTEGTTIPKTTISQAKLNAQSTGITYECGSQKSTLSDDGTFNFEEGKPCTFKDGDIVVKTISKNELKRNQTYEESLSSPNLRSLLDGSTFYTIDTEMTNPSLTELKFNTDKQGTLQATVTYNNQTITIPATINGNTLSLKPLFDYEVNFLEDTGKYLAFEQERRLYKTQKEAQQYIKSLEPIQTSGSTTSITTSDTSQSTDSTTTSGTSQSQGSTTASSTSQSQGSTTASSTSQSQGSTTASGTSQSQSSATASGTSQSQGSTTASGTSQSQSSTTSSGISNNTTTSSLETLLQGHTYYAVEPKDNKIVQLTFASSKNSNGTLSVTAKFGGLMFSTSVTVSATSFSVPAYGTFTFRENRNNYLLFNSNRRMYVSKDQAQTFVNANL